MPTSSFKHSNQALLGPDLLGSPALRSVSGSAQEINYTPFGYSKSCDIGFTGQKKEPLTGYYLLGNGYRAYSPSLMRFITADELSPFEHGGINAYAYCANEPTSSLPELWLYFWEWQD